MLVVPSASGMNQNQPWSNHRIVMLPSSLPSRRFAPVKWPYSAELLCCAFFCLHLKWFASSVSRPVASTRNFVRQLWRAPPSSSTFQGAVYANGTIDVGTTSTVDGPMVGSEVNLGQSVNTSFPSITIVPQGMPSNPTAYAQIDPPTGYSG
jgi:hypothetical protein